MGKEVKLTASGPLTADKEIRIGKTMGKSDEPTLIPIDKDLGGAKKKTVNKAGKRIAVKGLDGVDKREAERISDAADALVLDDVKPAKKIAKKSAGVALAKSGKTGAKVRAMDGMVHQKATKNTKPVDVRGDLDVEADKMRLDEAAMAEPKMEKSKAEAKVNSRQKKQLSKSKSTIIAVVVAVLVGVIGMAVMFMLGKPTETICVLKFESNGGEQVESQEVVCGTKATRPDAPEREGFEFQDWLVDGMPFDFESETVDKDMILMAKWLVGEGTEVVKITFDTAGGSEVMECEVVKGKTTTAPLEPTRDGYTFDGWYLDGEKFDFDTPIDEDITLVAGWKSGDGTVTKPQGGNSNTNKPALQIFTVTSDITMTAGENRVIQINANPVSAEVDIDVSSDNKSVVDCAREGTGRSMSCTAGNPGTAKITVKDKISGKTATTTITVNAEDTTTNPGGNGGGTSNPGPTKPTTPTKPSNPGETGGENSGGDEGGGENPGGEGNGTGGGTTTTE